MDSRSGEFRMAQIQKIGRVCAPRAGTEIADIDDFKLMMLIAFASIPLLLLLREARRRPPPAAAIPTAAADD